MSSVEDEHKEEHKEEHEEEASPAAAPVSRNPVTVHTDVVTDEMLAAAVAEGGGESLCLENVPHATGRLEAALAAYICSTATLRTLELRHCQLYALDNFANGACAARLERLDLRQNILEGVRALGSAAFAATLRELDVSDNRLASLRGVDGLAQLRVLDASYNVLGHVGAHLGALTQLEELYLAENRLRATDWVAPLRRLRVLELGANRIAALDPALAQLGALEALWLGRNRLATPALAVFARPAPLGTALRRLSLQLNRLEALPVGALAGLGGLTELYLSENGLTTIAGVAQLPALRILDVAQNRLASLAGVEALPALEEFWANDNRVADWDEVRRLRTARASLTVVYLEANPVAADPTYRTQLREVLPNLTQIDSSFIK